MRRRVRKVARMREALVRELGMLVAEMERLGRRNDELLVRKAREVALLDDELNGLRTALGRRLTLDQVVATGIAGACGVCGSLLGTEDRFCSHCGTPATESEQQSRARASQEQLQLQTVGAERP
jgi:NADH pyrophosphatase NudC (nudix superfamily)